MPTRYIRTSAALVMMILATVVAGAQIPRTISYQGVLADQAGNYLPDGNHTLEIALYDARTGGSRLFSESHQAAVVRGVFNLIIGSRTPLPPSIRFDRAYFLEVTVDGSTLSPRTALTAVPYAIRSTAADVADGLSPSATGAVRSVNGASGNLTITGADGTTIESSGDTITIRSSGSGGTGIQGVRAGDGSVTIGTPNGPVASIAVADAGITGAKLSKDAVTSDKIADGTIVGDDISSSTAITIAKLTNTGNASIGTTATGARLVVQGASAAAPGTALSVLNSTGASLLHVRNDGNIGIGTTTPGAALEIAAAGGLHVSGGRTILSFASVVAGVTIAIPPNISVVEINDDGFAAPNTVIMPALASFGQILIISNNDAQVTTGPAAIAPGQARMYVFTVGGLWRLVN